LHVLDDEIGGAEVNKSFHLLGICKIEPLQHVAKLLLSVVFVKDIPIHSDDLVPLLKLILTILTYHVLLEFSELASRNVDQLVVAGVVRRSLRGGHRLGAASLRVFLFLLVVASVFISYLRALLGVRSLGNGRWSADFVCVLVQLIDVVHVHLVELLRILTILRFVLVKVHSC